MFADRRNVWKEKKYEWKKHDVGVVFLFKKEQSRACIETELSWEKSWLKKSLFELWSHMLVVNLCPLPCLISSIITK